ncbi:hypothetical protein M2454_002635 [Aequitasia blattaphilus]|uniref:YcxB family protein n=1 Tax=Aequitasia blattaphilus TaxID=2949332 RepID=A0ABT1EBS0_9FIRM|nr:YcxB family protein [Aequitasia blattaphilus]MCP1103257.1 YcxB family protein [Aequitasia blattaphilus]MCR8615897.1 YcxB family protein [Aequitasia blattaphilus]
MSVKIKVQLDEQSMVDFMMYQIFTGGVGILCIVLGIINIGLVYVFLSRRDYPLALIFGVFILLIFVIFPMMIKRKVITQMRSSNGLKAPVSYEFSDEGIKTVTNRGSGKASWKAFKKAVSRKGIIMLFDGKKQSIILPVSQMGDDYTQVVDYIFHNMPAPAVRINRLDRKRK